MKLENFLKNIVKKVSLDNLHPIGEVYITTDSSFDPNKKWGGSWEQLTQDAYLKIVTSNAGTTGGNADHKITTEQMPSHYHGEDQRFSWNSSNKNTIAGGATSDWGYLHVDDPTVTSGGYRFINTNNAGGGKAYYPGYYGIYAWNRVS